MCYHRWTIYRGFNSFVIADHDNSLMVAWQTLQLPARYKTTLVKRMSLYSDNLICAWFFAYLGVYHTFSSELQESKVFNIMSHIANPSKYTRRYHPRQSLAQYIINQIESLELRPQDIVKQMGYPLKHTIPAYDRLRHVLSNKHLGLDGSYMDKSFCSYSLLFW